MLESAQSDALLWSPSFSPGWLAAQVGFGAPTGLADMGVAQMMEDRACTWFKCLRNFRHKHNVQFAWISNLPPGPFWLVKQVHLLRSVKYTIHTYSKMKTLPFWLVKQVHLLQSIKYTIHTYCKMKTLPFWLVKQAHLLQSIKYTIHIYSKMKTLSWRNLHTQAKLTLLWGKWVGRGLWRKTLIIIAANGAWL